MRFEDLVKKGVVRKGSKDLGKSRSILSYTVKDLKFLDSLKIDDSSSNRLIVNYYDMLRSILESISIREGYKVYFHESYRYFLEFIGEEKISRDFDRFRNIRNSIQYYPERYSVEEAKDYINSIRSTIRILIKKYFGVKNG